MFLGWPDPPLLQLGLQSDADADPARRRGGRGHGRLPEQPQAVDLRRLRRDPAQRAGKTDLGL